MPGVVAEVLPGAGGLGESTMPGVDGVVDGDGMESSETECVVGMVEAVGEEFEALPLTLLAGSGMLWGADCDGACDGDGCCVALVAEGL